MRIRCLLAILLLSISSVRAQEWNAMNPREFVIVYSTKNYSAALKTARDAARRLKYPLDLGGNRPHKTSGLSMTKADCEGSAWEYPCYTPRGNGGPPENARYVSIEWSTGYEGFALGYYIVVIAEGPPGSEVPRSSLATAKRLYPDAYAKATRVWFGCMH